MRRFLTLIRSTRTRTVLNSYIHPANTDLLHTIEYSACMDGCQCICMYTHERTRVHTLASN